MDTSATVSALIGGWWRTVAESVASGRLSLITSEALLAELADALTRPRISKIVPKADVDLLHQMCVGTAAFFKPGPSARICRDPKDDYLLALAAASDADYLVTRDEDLLVLGHHGVTEILYPAKLLQLLASATPPE